MTAAPTAESTTTGWPAVRTVLGRGYSLLNRLAFWFSFVVVFLVITQLADADWGNFRRQAWYHLFVVGWMFAATYTLRSVGTREAVRLWMAGFFPVTFLSFVIPEFTESRIDPGNLQTAGIVPVVEEIAKILPLVLWTTLLRPRHRHGTLSDFLVLGFATGAGFAFHEDALYTRVAATGFDEGVLGTLFPMFLVTPTQYAITHAGWTAIAAVGVGLISLHRRRPAALVGGTALIVLPIVDHADINYRGDGGQWMGTLTGDGERTAWILLATVVLVIVHDAGALRWATARDRFFPPVAVADDLAVLRVGAWPARIRRLVLHQQYRRRRNATFIDLFAVRSRGVSAGDRTSVRRALEIARARIDEPAATHDGAVTPRRAVAAE